MCGRHHDHDHAHDHLHLVGVDQLSPLPAAPEPGYPAWGTFDLPKRGGALRKAAAATTVSLALCFGACGGDPPPSGAPVETVATDEPPRAAEPAESVEPDPSMGARLGMPLALALETEERSPGSSTPVHSGGGAGTKIGSAIGARTPIINLAPLDANVADVTEPVAKPRPRPRPVRMSGCSGMR